MSQSIDVSVIIAAYKAQDTIHKAIESALFQTGVTLEVIVVDDASPDQTFEAVQAMALNDDRLIAAKLEENGGPSKARNKGIELAKGRYFAVLDADDSFLPGRLEKMISVADSEDADLIVDNIKRVDIQGDAIDEGVFLAGSQYKHRHQIALEDYIRGNVMMSGEANTGYLKPIVKVDSLKAWGVSYDETLRNSEDYYLVADLLANKAKMVFEPFAGYIYQVGDGSISHRLTTALTTQLVDAVNRFNVRHEGKLSPSDIKATKIYGRRIEHIDVFQQIIDRLKHRQPVSALSVWLYHLDASKFVSIQFFKSLRSRLSNS